MIGGGGPPGGLGLIPLAVMTTFPAEALLGTLEAQSAAIALGASLAFSLAARAVWIDVTAGGPR